MQPIEFFIPYNRSHREKNIIFVIQTIIDIFMSTLQIDSVLLHEAEQIAKLHNTDLTQMVESFIRRYIEQTKKSKHSAKITPFVKQLGADLNLPADFDEKEAYRKHLEEKYK